LGCSEAVVINGFDFRVVDVDVDSYLLVDFLIPIGHCHLADELWVRVRPGDGRRLSHAFDAFDGAPTFGNFNL
jgi:hypothetical protein